MGKHTIIQYCSKRALALGFIPLGLYYSIYVINTLCMVINS